MVKGKPRKTARKQPQSNGSKKYVVSFTRRNGKTVSFESNKIPRIKNKKYHVETNDV